MVSASSLLLLLSSTASAYKAVQGHYGEYSIVKGFFKQADSSTNRTTFDYHDNLGLYDNLTWSEFGQEIEELNANAPLNTTYKVIYYARHAEGWHNVASEVYGEAFSCYYGQFYSDGNMTWGPDPFLTPYGLEEAHNNSDLVKSLISKGFPLPQSFYSSPFTRCADTLSITWNDTVLNPGYASPIFKESLREVIGGGTCVERRDRPYLEARYPKFSFEANFVSDDVLYEAKTYETMDGMYWRARQFLDDIFTSDPNTFISATAHGGIGAALLEAVGHIVISLGTGEIIPIVVKRESRLDFIPVPLNTTAAQGPFSTTVASCAATLTYSTVPSDIAYSTISVTEGNESILTVTRVVSTTVTPITSA